MKLTNVIRDQFVDAVMAALPWKNTLDYKQAVAEFERRAFALLPAEVIALSKKYPGMLAMSTDSIPGMPHRAPYVKEGDQYAAHRTWNAVHPRLVDVKQVKFDDIRKKIAARDEEDLQRNERRLQLKGIAYSATTTEALEKALPELASFVPKPVHVPTPFPVVPAGFVEGLKKAGLKVAKVSRAKAVAA